MGDEVSASACDGLLGRPIDFFAAGRDVSACFSDAAIDLLVAVRGVCVCVAVGRFVAICDVPTSPMAMGCSGSSAGSADGAPD